MRNLIPNIFPSKKKKKLKIYFRRTLYFEMSYNIIDPFKVIAFNSETFAQFQVKK